MDSRLSEWQLELERIWQAAAPDWREAARLTEVMARTGAEALLRQAATQALPILRHAAAATADPAITDAARRRADFRHALSAFLDLVVISLAAGAGVDGALDDASGIGHGWAFTQLRRALAATNYNVAETARQLGLAREHVYYYLNKYGLRRPD